MLSALKTSWRISVFIGITIAVLVLDQWTKVLATNHLLGAPTTTYLGDTFRLQYAVNQGAFLSLGHSLSPGARFAIFTVATGILLLGLTIYTFITPMMTKTMLVSYALFISGGLGNWIDRARFDGMVVDFLNMGIGPVRTGVFNVADVAVMVGIGLLLLSGRKAQREMT